MSYQVHAVTRADVPRVAAYLASRSGHEGVETVAHRLAWRLFDNPAVHPEVAAGHLLADDEGGLAGISLAIRQRFTDGSHDRFGLCSSAMYVDERARLQGFLLFRQFLAQPHTDFWFATTCNAASAALWERSGGVPDRASRHELVLPLHRLLRWLRRTPVTLERTADFERLAALAARCARPGEVEASRDARSLEWRYAGGPDAGARRVWLVRSRSGEEGWVAAGRFPRAFSPRRRCWMLLDAVWPGEDLTGVVVALAHALDGDGDLLAVRGRHARAVSTRLPLGLRRRFPHPPVWVRPASAHAARLVPADGDTAP